jgi:hypothetical protein
MKRTLSFFMSLALAPAFMIAAVQAHAASIKDDMKQIKNLYKEISAAVSDPSKNAKSAANAADIAKLFADAQTGVPEAISDLPAEEQADANADFKSMIQQEIDYANALQKAFDSGNNSLAAEILQQMDGVKKEGHKKYSD